MLNPMAIRFTAPADAALGVDRKSTELSKVVLAQGRRLGSYCVDESITEISQRRIENSLLKAYNTANLG